MIRGGVLVHGFSAVIQLLVYAMPSSAQPTDEMTRFGLFGTWANDCSVIASSTNEYAIFSQTARGELVLRNDFGPDYGNMVYRITDARLVGYYRLSMHQQLIADGSIVLDVVMLRAGSRIRVWSSRGVDGTIYVRDGLMPSANDQETGWMVRCEGQWTEMLGRGAALAYDFRGSETARRFRSDRSFSNSRRASACPWPAARDSNSSAAALSRATPRAANSIIAKLY